MLAVVLRSVALFQAERYDDVRPEYDRLEELTSYIAEYIDYYQGTLSALCGDIAAATPRVRRFARQEMPKLAMDAEWLPGAAMFSEALRIVGDGEGAAPLYDRLLPFRTRYAIEGIGAGTYGSVELHLGLLAATCGRREEAEDHFTRAIDANARLGAPLLVARAQRELAGVLRERGDDKRADDLMRLATDVRDRLLRDGERSRSAGAVLVRDGELWTVSFDGSTVRVKDAKGLHDLVTLLRRPGLEVAALDLATERGVGGRMADGDLGVPGHAGELLDDDARASYKARLDELDEEIAAADDLGDPVRAERARQEREAIVDQLTAAYGLGGRPRRAGDPAERARTTVTRRIRDAIGRIEAVHPQLGLHLRNSVRTGAFCSYVPEHPVTWELDRLTT
jgi:tetratricopeptide (TPR) repeat protein